MSGATKDLGVIDAPVLVFGGPYSNFEATRAVLKAAAQHDIPPARMICTGDVVAYCANPQETTDLVVAAGLSVVQGNCEISLGADLDDCGCGFDEGTTCDRLSAQWYAYATAHISMDARRWMAALPGRLEFEMAGRRLAVVHGAPSAVNRFVFASGPAADKVREIDLSGCDGVISGHCGLPFTQVIDERLWHNAGVIGLPANDGTPRVWYSILSPEDGGLRITHHALDYDAEAAAAAMRRCGLPTEYEHTLTTGLWDNCDILPPEETRARGTALTPSTTFWPGKMRLSA